MKRLLALVVAAAAVAAAQGQDTDAGKRYDIAADPAAYPQATPKETLASVIKAVEDRRIDYLLAHLADPEFVDKRVKEVHGGRFEGMVQETTAKLDGLALRQLQRFARDGTWDVGTTRAMVRLKDVADRAVFFRKAGGRWFMEQRYRPDP
jgi:hypothetical protein